MPKSREFDFFRENTGDDATFEQFNDDWTPEDGYRYPREVDQPRGDKANKAAEDAKRELSYQAATAAASELEAADEAAEEGNDYDVDPFATWDGDKNADSGITEDDLKNMPTEKLLELYQKYLAAEARIEAGKEAEKSYNQSPLSPEKAARARKTREKLEKKKRAKGHITRYIAAGVAAAVATLSLIGANVTSKKDTKQNEPRNAYTNTVKSGGADEALAAQGAAYDSYDDYAAKTGKQNTVNTPATTTAETVRSQTSVAQASETYLASNQAERVDADLVAESWNGTSTDLRDYVSNEKIKQNAFGTDDSYAYGNEEATIDAIVGKASESAAFLASHCDKLTESEKQELGIANLTAEEINNLINTRKDGGQLQQAIQKKLAETLSDSTKTRIEFREAQPGEVEYSLYAYALDANGNYVKPTDIKSAKDVTLHIDQDRVVRAGGEKQAIVYRFINNANGGGDWVAVSMVNLGCGTQSFQIEAYTGIATSSEVEVTKEENESETSTETESETGTETETETGTEIETETGTESETGTEESETGQTGGGTETEITTESESGGDPVPEVVPGPGETTPDKPAPETEEKQSEPAPETEPGTEKKEETEKKDETDKPAPETEEKQSEPAPETEPGTEKKDETEPQTETPTPESEYEGKGENPHAGNPEEHEKLATTVNSKGDTEVEQTAGNTAAQSNPGDEVTNNTIEEARGDSEAAPGSAAIAENQGITNESGEAVVDSTSGEQVVIENGAGMSEQLTDEQVQEAVEQAIQDNNEGVASTFDAYETNEDHSESVQADNAYYYTPEGVPEDTGNGAGEGSQAVDELVALINSEASAANNEVASVEEAAEPAPEVTVAEAPAETIE